ILNIEDSRTSKQIGFINATENFDALLKKVESGNIKAIFALYPVNIKDVFRISDAGGIMPPKSTWMEPKLRGGLVIHKF
ncbi:MAG: DUF1015 domain-containing protein, partial [Bacteroidetes bacterium]|nr:DUF1015 domain-containing protein [Bacteroidota bacterium]